MKNELAHRCNGSRVPRLYSKALSQVEEPNFAPFCEIRPTTEEREEAGNLFAEVEGGGMEEYAPRDIIQNSSDLVQALSNVSPNKTIAPLFRRLLIPRSKPNGRISGAEENSVPGLIKSAPFLSAPLLSWRRKKEDDELRCLAFECCEESVDESLPNSHMLQQQLHPQEQHQKKRPFQFVVQHRSDDASETELELAGDITVTADSCDGIEENVYTKRAEGYDEKENPKELRDVDVENNYNGRHSRCSTYNSEYETDGGTCYTSDFDEKTVLLDVPSMAESKASASWFDIAVGSLGMPSMFPNHAGEQQENQQEECVKNDKPVMKRPMFFDHNYKEKEDSEELYQEFGLEEYKRQVKTDYRRKWLRFFTFPDLRGRTSKHNAAFTYNPDERRGTDHSKYADTESTLSTNITRTKGQLWRPCRRLKLESSDVSRHLTARCKQKDSENDSRSGWSDHVVDDDDESFSKYSKNLSSPQDNAEYDAWGYLLSLFIFADESAGRRKERSYFITEQ